MRVKVLGTDEYRWQSPHPLQQQGLRRDFPRKRRKTPDFLSAPACGGSGCAALAAADDGGLRRALLKTVPKFHVSQVLLADAEVAEDYVEQIFDVDAAGDAAEGAGGQTNVFGDKIGLPGL